MGVSEPGKPPKYANDKDKTSTFHETSTLLPGSTCDLFSDSDTVHTSSYTTQNSVTIASDIKEKLPKNSRKHWRVFLLPVLESS